MLPAFLYSPTLAWTLPILPWALPAIRSILPLAAKVLFAVILATIPLIVPRNTWKNPLSRYLVLRFMAASFLNLPKPGPRFRQVLCTAELPLL